MPEFFVLYEDGTVREVTWQILAFASITFVGGVIALIRSAAS